MTFRSFLRAATVGALLTACAPQAPRATPPESEGERLQRRARAVTITRDDWGIAHVRAATDADAVFGMMYAQAEDDFNRVETNFINAMGRLAEAEGESAIWDDLRMKLFIDPDTLKAQYAASPSWLRALMDGWADGLNHYLATHPAVTPRVISRFEPWMALSFSEGSIGGDIESISVEELEKFYARHQLGLIPPPASRHAVRPQSKSLVPDSLDPEPRGSNGFAIAPANSATGHALLLINPHTSFFFRAEQQVTSDEGLNVYGAATWGQFFVYQGFNERAGWMHTSSGVDVIDEFTETIVERDGRRFYRYGAGERPLVVDTIAVPFRTSGGGRGERRFVVFRTHRGPIVREEGGRWITVALMHRPVEALQQSWLRTKTRDYASFREVSDRFKANSSNNTIFADASGHIAYMHPQFIPRRDDRFDYTRPVDGSDPATDWKGLHALDEAPAVVDPPNGWIMNTNNWPWSAASQHSPRADAFPRYMDTAGENARGIHAIMVLQGKKDFTLASLIAAAYDSYLPAFASSIPRLVADHDALAATSPLRRSLAGQVAALRGWDFRWGVSSIPTSLAVFWGEEMQRRHRQRRRETSESASPFVRRPTAPETLDDFMTAGASSAERLDALAEASARLERDFGSWRTPWGEINRFQRLTGDIDHPFSDAAPSIPVGFTSATWGSLASFGARPHDGSRKYYGTSGNSFVAVVEFGDSVRARAVSAGGQSSDPKSPHFNDQALRYSTGDLREVYFYPSQLVGHTERTYHPGM